MLRWPVDWLHIRSLLTFLRITIDSTVPQYLLPKLLPHGFCAVRWDLFGETKRLREPRLSTVPEAWFLVLFSVWQRENYFAPNREIEVAP